MAAGTLYKTDTDEIDGNGKIVPFAMPPLAPEEKYLKKETPFIYEKKHWEKDFTPNNYKQKLHADIYSYSLVHEFNKAANSNHNVLRRKPTSPGYLTKTEELASAIDNIWDDVRPRRPVSIPLPPQKKQGPSFFERIGEGLSRAFKAAYDMVTEGMRRKAAFDEAIKVIDHALFTRPKDVQVWLLRADVAREIDVMAGRHYYNRPDFDDMPPQLRDSIDKARREIAYQTIIGTLKDSAEKIIEGRAPYDLPKRFTLSEHQVKQAFKALETINQTLGTPMNDIDAWVRREEAAEEMAALMGEEIPPEILANLPEDLAKEIDAKRRFIAFKRLTGEMLEETLALRHNKEVALPDAHTNKLLS